MLQYVTRPLSDKTWLKPGRGQPSRFDSNWPSTQALLEREIRLLKGKNLVIEVDVREGDLRLDGQLKAKAKASSPAVRIAFDSMHGPMLFQCDRYSGGPWNNKMESWQHNVRAITLTLEALRAVERHEAINSGQQYTGFKAIEGPKVMTHVQAHRVVLDLIDGDKTDLQTDWKRARRNAHPDRNGGDQTRWDELMEAGKVLGLL